MRSDVTRRDFLAQATYTGILATAVRPILAADGMYVSLNGSLVNKPNQSLPWPDFVRLAGKLGYGGVDVSLGAARKDGVEATKALLADAKVKPGITNLP